MVGRAIGRGVIDVGVHDLRDFTTDRHRVVDDMPFGGGPGMVMKPEPFFAAVEHIRRERGTPDAIVLTSPDGDRVRASGRRTVERARARRDVVRPLRRRRRARAAPPGHRGACRSATTCCRAASCRRWSCWTRSRAWCRASSETKSRWRGIRLSAGCWTTRSTRGRRVLQGHEVPAVLLSGHHAAIARWRRREALARTLARRPDLLDAAALDDDDRELSAWTRFDADETTPSEVTSTSS